MFSRQYRWVAAGNVMVTVLLPEGENVYGADAFTVVKLVPSVEASSDRVSSRAPQDAGSCRTTRLAACAEPRSTCTHCGNTLLVLSQYEDRLPSVTFEAGNPELVDDAAVGRPAARF